MTETHRLLVRIDKEWRLVKSGLDYSDAMDAWHALMQTRDYSIQFGKETIFDSAVVRSDSDPDPRWATAKQLRKKIVRFRGERTTDLRTLGKWLVIGLRPDWTAKEGGWIYRSNGKPFVQGYSNVPSSFRGYWKQESNPFGYVLTRAIPTDIAEKGN